MDEPVLSNVKTKPALERMEIGRLPAAADQKTSDLDDAASKDHVTQAPAPIIVAAADGDLQGITELVASGVDVNLQDAMGGTPLIFAVLNRQHQSVCRLLELGADPFLQTKKGRSAWSLARDGKDRQLAELLFGVIDSTPQHRERLRAGDKPIWKVLLITLGLCTLYNLLWLQVTSEFDEENGYLLNFVTATFMFLGVFGASSFVSVLINAFTPKYKRFSFGSVLYVATWASCVILTLMLFGSYYTGH